jgi:hypothetical protein
MSVSAVEQTSLTYGQATDAILDILANVRPNAREKVHRFIAAHCGGSLPPASRRVIAQGQAVDPFAPLDEATGNDEPRFVPGTRRRHLVAVK